MGALPAFTWTCVRALQTNNKNPNRPSWQKATHITMSTNKSELRIQQLQDDRNKSLRSLSTLTLEGKENTPAAKALQQAIDDAEKDISALRKIASNPNFIAVQEKQATEARDRQTDHVVAQTASTVTANVVNAITSNKSAESRARVGAAYKELIRRGESLMSRENRDLLQTSANGISLVPEQFSDIYLSALKQVSPLAATAKSVNDSRITKQFYADDSANNQSLISESSAITGLEADPAFSSFTPVYTDSVASMVKVSWQLLEDQNFTFEDFLRVVTQGRTGRFYDSAILTGKDVNGNALPNSGASLLAATTGGVVQSNPLATGVKYADFVSLVGSLTDVVYNDGAAFLVSPAIRQQILTNLLSSTGEPLYTFNATGELTLLGRPVWCSNYFPSYSASQKVALYGRFDLAYQYQYSNHFYVARERFADTQETGFSIVNRYVGSPAVSKAVVALTSAAS